MNRVLHAFFNRAIHTGTMTVEAPGTCFTVGDGTGNPIRMELSDTAASLWLVSDPSMALGDLYMEGRLRMREGSIYDLLALAWSNLGLAEAPGPAKVWAYLRSATRRFKQLNDRTRAKQNVAHHYDLNCKLYSLFLDGDWQYSCAYFSRPHQRLDEAQQAKKRHIAAKLHIRPGDRVLDIGSGWGGLALYLANICDARVDGITLSAEQLAMAGERAGDNTSVAFRLQDYREVEGHFDRIVSVGMFEHVGQPFYDAYFAKCADLLDRDGVMLLHTIGRIDGPGPTNPWMGKYIFPGGYAPALSEILPSVEHAGLVVTDVEILRLHYAETLRAWRERFAENREKARALYDERFCRMWEYYLACCETAFRFGNLVVFQIQMAKHLAALPITRDYIAESEKKLEEAERRQEAAAISELPLGMTGLGRRAIA